jgi:hypothetical protein
MSKNLSFDFRQAVEQSLRDYPQLHYNTVFMNAAEHPLDTSPLTMHGTTVAKLKTFAREAFIKKNLSIAREDGSSFALTDTPQSYFALILGDKVIPTLGEQPFLMKNKSFFFDHELGHILTKRSEQNSAFPLSECSADAFAAIRHIQRFGNETGVLEHVAWYRAFKLVDRGQSLHFTTPVIDKIIFDSRTQDFSKLSPLETVEAAKKYADDYTPVFMNIQNVKAEHREFTDAPDGDMRRKLACLASTCLKTSDPFSFYIGSRVFNAFFHPEGKTIKGQNTSLAREQDFRRLQAEILGCSERFQNLLPHQTMRGYQSNAAKP